MNDLDRFRADGYLHVPGVLDAHELESLRAATAPLIDSVEPGQRDVSFEPSLRGETPVLRRVEYVVDKLTACRVLLGHPRILAIVEALQGPAFIPTWDSMVVKMPGEGAEVAWHRDAGTDQVGDWPIFNVDIYLDDSDEQTAVRVVPGSHRWSDARADEEIRSRETFDGALSVPVAAGDVVLHDILLVHGSPSTRGNDLRRVVYYEFRPIATELAIGPHTPEYVPLKQAVLRACLAARAADRPDETPYDYRPTATPVTSESFRVPHHRYWRSGSQSG